MRLPLVFLCCALACSFVLACSSAPVTSDAGSDTGLDASAAPDAGTPDSGYCAMACPGAETCCYASDGTPHCVDLSSDITNCGICNRDCVASRRGDRCAHFQCGCGDFEIGCTGAENSICCASVTGLQPYCANPGLDFSDCGGCGHACDAAQANQCSGGLCLCGDSGGACAGTIDDLCCADPAGAFTCVDARSDQAHCGSCDQRCSAFEHCVSGTCVSTLPDAGGPDAP